MAEGLAIVGGIASISQILELTIKSAKRLRKLSQDVKDAPLEIKRLQNKLSALQIVLQGVTKLIENVDEDTIFPPEQRSMLEDVVKQVQEDVEELEALRVKVVARAPDSLRGRLSWGVKDKAAAERLCARLRETEQCLSTVLQALDL
jgi:predicted lipoprotein